MYVYCNCSKDPWYSKQTQLISEVKYKEEKEEEEHCIKLYIVLALQMRSLTLHYSYKDNWWQWGTMRLMQSVGVKWPVIHFLHISACVSWHYRRQLSIHSGCKQSPEWHIWSFQINSLCIQLFYSADSYCSFSWMAWACNNNLSWYFCVFVSYWWQGFLSIDEKN